MSKIRKVSDQKNLIQACDLFDEFTLLEEVEEIEDEEQEPEDEEESPAEEDFTEEIVQQIIEKARQEAREILCEAREQAEILREEAYQEGHAQGEEAGYQQAYQEHKVAFEGELRVLQKNIADTVKSVTREKEMIMEKYVDELKNIVLTISEKIIQTSIQSSGEIIKRMILSATDKMMKRQWAKIYITKCKTGISMEADEKFLEALSHLSDNVKIIVMDNGEEGTCIVELPDEIIDASVSTQLENIKDVLNNARL